MESRIRKIEKQQYDFIVDASRIMHDVFSQGKQKFMYELRQEDIELIEEGKKIRAIRKIIS